jgi:genome maintenance exonuclease 1
MYSWENQSMNTLNPPRIIERYQYKSCEQINDLATGKRKYLTPDGEYLPSVTTILSSTKDQTHLDQWRERVGHEKAKQITKDAANLGTAMHNNLENFVFGKPRQQGSNLIHQKANKMANVIIEHGLSKVSEIWAIEQSLYYPGLYSGTTDGIGVYEGKPVIFDYKQTNKPKKEEWVQDYYLQLVSYAMAHNEVYGTDIKEGVIFMCSQAFEFQKFQLTRDKFQHYQNIWMDRIEQHYLNFA